MKAFSAISAATVAAIKYVLTDIDDTLTIGGRLPAIAFSAMEKLQGVGVKVIPVTGRPAGWCDHIARMWPVDGVVGENGAFYFYYDEKRRKMVRRYWRAEEERRQDKLLLKQIEAKVLQAVPGCAVSVDQPYREADLAIDFCEDVEPLENSQIEKIVALFKDAGAVAKVSSIHVNGWFGDYDKLGMSRIFFQEIFAQNLADINEKVIFTGDSPNDAPMFSYFKNSVGVANIKAFADQLTEEEKPAWVTEKKGGYGFAEVAERLMKG